MLETLVSSTPLSRPSSRRSASGNPCNAAAWSGGYCARPACNRSGGRQDHQASVAFQTSVGLYRRRETYEEAERSSSLVGQIFRVRGTSFPLPDHGYYCDFGETLRCSITPPFRHNQPDETHVKANAAESTVVRPRPKVAPAAVRSDNALAEIAGGPMICFYFF